MAAASICPRFPYGSIFQDALPNIYSNNRVLDVALTYQSVFDQYNNSLYCYMLPDGIHQSPTLRMDPGDTLHFTLTNLYNPVDSNSSLINSTHYALCGSDTMTASSTNVHFHGIHSPPKCHDDYAMATIINYGDTFTYAIDVPLDQPPGLYWYHPHVFPLAEIAVQGGATGVFIVNGIENVKPELSGLEERILVFRDTAVESDELANTTYPGYDLSLNYIPIKYPDYTTPNLPIRPSAKQFWRIANTAADTILNLTLTYDNIGQRFEVVGLDGTPTTTNLLLSHLYLMPGQRAEVIVTAPALSVKNAVLAASLFDMGPVGEIYPARPLLLLEPRADAPLSSTIVPAAAVSAPPASLQMPPATEVQAILALTPAKRRLIIFTEILSDPSDPASLTFFFVTEDGHKPVYYDMKNLPAIIAQQGTVEDWVLQNRATETHVFHIHQMHFLVLNSVKPVDNGAFRDVVEVPYWTGNLADPYPNVTVRLDFTRKEVVGDFVYHCHILSHEDFGMMAGIRVVAAGTSSQSSSSSSADAKVDRDLVLKIVLPIGIALCICVLVLVSFLACSYLPRKTKTSATVHDQRSPDLEINSSFSLKV